MVFLGTLTTAQSSSGGLTGVWYVKNRLWISGNDGTAEYIWEKVLDAWNTGWLADADSIVEMNHIVLQVLLMVVLQY